MMRVAGENPALTNRLSLRCVIFGGEALEPLRLEQWYRYQPPSAPVLVNMYGITETTVHVSYLALDRDLARTARGSPIGGNIPDLRVYVLDAGLEPVPAGVTGELYVAGGGLARGYLNRAGITAQRFIADPHALDPGRRMYRTGDLARWRPDGTLEFLGRADQQVKIRGFRIEPGEIEAVLLAHPAVTHAAVLARETSGAKQLVAYIVASTGAHPREIRSWAEAKLPDYMVPAHFILLDRLPLTTNGKLDREALPKVKEGSSKALSEDTPPLTETECQLAAIWRRVLDVDRVGAEDNFFELGGDSMLTLQIVAEARALNINFSIRDLYEAGTIRALSRKLEIGREAAEPVPNTSPFCFVPDQDRSFLPVGLDDAYPLARLQAGMFYHSELDPETAIFHDIFSFHVRMPFDEEAWRKAARRIVQEHPILRTSFHWEGLSEPLQYVHAAATLPVANDDLRRLSRQEQDAAVSAWFEAEKHRPFNPGQAPLARLQLHRRGEEEFQLGFSCHHAILDGWSCATFFTRLAGCYFNITQGQEPAQTHADGHFRDFIALERHAIGSEASRQYWTERLADLEVHRLTRPSSVTQDASPSLGEHALDISEELSDGLKRVARRAGVPLKTVLLAANFRVVGVLSGTHDVVTGMVSNGRPETTSSRDILGLFLNTVPFRLQLRPETWFELIRRVFEAEQEVLPHRRFPLIEIMKLCGRRELYDVGFNFVHFRVYTELLSSRKIELLSSESFAKDDSPLTAHFSLAPENERIGLTLSYSTREFTRHHMARVGGFYLRALRSIAAADLGSQLHRSEILDREERQMLLEYFNATAREVPKSTLPELFEAQVRRSPEATALLFRDATLTYAQLNVQANRLAHLLMGRGIGPESIVSLCVPRSAEMVICLLAILKAGAAYLPLDPEYPVERLTYMLRDAQPACVLTSARIAERLPKSVAQLLLGHPDTDSALAQSRETNPSDAERTRPLTPYNPAYVIYTSGSTGTPKGVIVAHGAIVNRLVWMQSAYKLQSDDRVLQKTPVGFDVSVWEFFWPLAYGATLVIAKPEGHKDPAYLSTLIRTERVTTVHFVPSMLRAFLQEPSAGGCRGLRRVMCSGETLTADLQQRFLSTLDVSLHNLYGPTEAAVDVSFWRCQADAGSGPVPIGYPIWNTRVYVLDASLQAVPVGVPGDLYIAGGGLARGYLKRPALSAERFVADPYGAPGTRMYRTGDLARWRPEGVLDFLGRADQQLKIRGFRIEPGEIEAVLARHPSVAQAAVIGREDPGGHKRLVGYVVAQSGHSADPALLRSHVAQSLPEYMLPGGIVVLEALPLTPNGKLDRKALPAQEFRASAGAAWRAPRTAYEEILCALFAQTLGVPRVGVDDNFFELGGHSLLATRLISRIRAALGIELPIRSLFEAPTVAGLLEPLDLGTNQKSLDVILPLRSSGNLPPLFCVHPAGGLSWCYSGLLQHIRADYPIYGLQARSFNQPEILPQTLQEMVADYLGQIRAIQPTGPYHLLGWSFGGLVAYSLGTHLQHQGEQVALLVLLDTYPPDPERSRDVPDEQEIINALLKDLGYDPAILGERPLQLSTLKELLRQKDSVYSNLEDQYLGAIPRIFRNNVRLAGSFVPETFDGDLLFFAAVEDSPAPPTDAWRPYVRGQITIRQIACRHPHLTQPGPIAQIGEALAVELQKRHNSPINPTK